MSAADVIKAVAVTAELTGTELSATALRVMAADLECYPEHAVMSSLVRCRRELTGRLTLATIIERLAQSDGRPSADEAWAIALDARDEAKTVVWNNEISEAFGIARPVLDAGDKVGARMAFRDAYDRIARNGRESGSAPNWSASLGWDVSARESALLGAEKKGFLSRQTVSALLPQKPGVIEQALFGGKLLSAPCSEDQQKVLERCKKLKEILSDKTEEA